MAMALKMLPCKKRRAAAAAGPPSPRERGEDAELPGGSGAAEGGGSGRPAGRGPGEASPKSGRKAPVRAAPSPGQELPAGPGSPAAAVEGKIPKLYTEVEVSSQRDLCPSENPGPVPESPGRSSLQVSAARNPSTMKPPKNTRAEEQEGEDVERRKRRRKASKRKREVKSQEEEGSLSCDIKLDESLDRTLEDGAKQHNLTVVNVRNILHVSGRVRNILHVSVGQGRVRNILHVSVGRVRNILRVSVGRVRNILHVSVGRVRNILHVSVGQGQEHPARFFGTFWGDFVGFFLGCSGLSLGHSGGALWAFSWIFFVASSGLFWVCSVGPLWVFPGFYHFFVRLCGCFCAKLCLVCPQPLEDSLIALRTRSKRPLKDVPLGQLEAELRAPDITPDMYEPSTGDDEEWERWLRGLMNDDVDNEDEADDDDDPEYNFLEDLDEPDTEDFRNDRAVRITKKEVNELMEELFETFQGEMGFSSMKDERPEDGDAVPESRPNFNTPQALRFEEPLANLLNKQHQTVKEQLEQLRIRKSSLRAPQESERGKTQSEKLQGLEPAQGRRLQQQMQQHVQLLTQIHLLASFNPALSSEASTTHMFLAELSSFARSSRLQQAPLQPRFQSAFQPCNLQGALQLLQDCRGLAAAEGSPRKGARSANEFSCLPKQVAWILATRKVFMYPELLPVCSLRDPPRDKIVFTKAEDNLLALGLKLEGTDFPKPLISKYLLPIKTAHQLTVRIKNLTMNRAPDNIIRYYKKTKQLPLLGRCCEDVQPHEWKAPVEREERLPFWLKASLPSLQRELKQLAEQPLFHREAQPWWPQSGFPAQGDAAGPGRGEDAQAVREEGPPGEKRDETAPVIKASPVIQPSPVILTVPATTVKVLNIGNGCNVIQPLGTAVGRGAQAIPVTTLLVNPSLPCPLNQPLVTFHPSLIVSPSPVGLSAPAGAEGDEKLTLLPAPAAFPAVEPKVEPPELFVPCSTLSPKKERGTAPAHGDTQDKGNKGDHHSWAVGEGDGSTAEPCPGGAFASLRKARGRQSSAAPRDGRGLPQHGRALRGDPGRPEAAGDRDGQEEEEEDEFDDFTQDEDEEMSSAQRSRFCQCQSCRGEFQEENSEPEEEEEEGEGMENSHKDDETGGDTAESPICFHHGPGSLPTGGGTREASSLENPDAPVEIKSEDLSDAPKEANPAQQRDLVCAERKEEFMLGLGQELNMEAACACGDEPKQEQGPCEEKGEEERQAEPCPAQGEQQGEPGGAAGPPGMGDSPRNPPWAGEREAEFSSPPGRPEDSPSMDGHSVGTPAGPEAAGDRDGQEEEEEDEFDDFTQDEDEEMSSASEESILSVPELQETMEKLTWLATERRLSQEGDSEEENSQEENSEPEEEEEEEGEGMENSHKDDETCGDTAEEPKSASTTAQEASPQVEAHGRPAGDALKGPGRGRSCLRSRSRRGRARGSKDSSKLLLLYAEDILERDPLREQKDLAFAQAYLSRVRETLQHIPGKYEDFLRVIYEFEISADKRTAVDLYCTLQKLLHDWPQLLTDFAAFLLPEQALECGLFEEQQAFEKSRKFLRQLEICFAENPAHHQKIIKVLQSCADCVPQEIAELKTQMWQLLKGHDHLQDEFSVFFDHLRPCASRMGDFEEINWTEEKEYEFDGFEEVSLPDVEEEEEPPKIHGASRNKKRKEIGGQQHHDKEVEWVEGLKECSCPCPCREPSSDPKLKKSKRRSCSHCGSKVCEGKLYKSKECQELPGSLAQREPSPQPEGKEPGTGREEAEESLERGEEAEESLERGEEAEESLERGEETQHGQGRSQPGSRNGEAPSPGECSPCPQVSAVTDPRGFSAGPQLEGRGVSSRPCEEPAPAAAQLPEGSSAGVDAAKDGDSAASDPRWAQLPKAALKLPQETKGCPGGLEQPGGDAEGLSRDLLLSAAARGTPGPHPHQPEGLHSEHGGSALAPEGGRELEGAALALAGAAEAKQSSRSESSSLDTQHRGCPGAAPQARPRPNGSSSCLGQQQPGQVEPRAGAASPGHREEEQQQQRVTEATVCAKNSKVSSTGEKVVLWTREADRVILTTCQEKGAHLDTFHAISQKLGNKTASEVSHRFRELMRLFHTSCDGSSEDEEDATSTSNTDQLSDKDLLLSEEEPDD
ncbi:LOW QUALITY PROTEIN: GON-4-like protein [Geothlypis trichas]